MARPVQMKICVDCRAPNPFERFECYKCGERLDKIAEGAPAPGERSYPCLNCGARMATDAKACPSCGRVPVAGGDFIGTPQVAYGSAFALHKKGNIIPFPKDWHVNPLPDGTYLLHRTLWARAKTTHSWWWLLAGLPILPLFFRVRGDQTFNAILLGLSCALLACVFAVALCYLLFAREELRVGPNLLIVDRRLGTLRQSRRIEGPAGFRIETIRDSDSVTRRLIVENLGGRVTLDTQLRADLPLARGVYGVAGTEIEDAVRRLGGFLAATTGWILVDPAFGETVVNPRG